MKTILIFIFTLFTFTFAATKELKIYKFNVYTADSQLIVFPSGYSILIDAGEKGGAKKEEGINGKYLSRRIQEIIGMKKVDVFVLTHFHHDHHGYCSKGGIWYLLEREGFSFGKFIHRNIGSYNGEKLSNCNKNTMKWNIVGSMSEEEALFVCYATSSNEKTKLSKIGQVAKICSKTQIAPPDDGASVQILMSDAVGVKDSNGKKLNRNSMNEKYPVNENDFSICLRIVYGKFVYASCGDLSGVETVIKSTTKNQYHDVESSVAPMMGEVDVYHVNHHGSKSATNSKWTKTLKPTVAVISCGDGSLPNAQPLKNLKGVKATVYTTQTNCGSNVNKYSNIVEMGDDVVITVPTNGTKFTVASPSGKKSKTYEIKQNKKAPTACKKLE